MDNAIRDVVQAVVDRFDGAVYEIGFDWNSSAAMWFTEVEPHDEQAASLSVAFDGEDLLNVTVGNAHFEVFPFDESSLDYLSAIVEAVAHGKVEETGSNDDAAMHIHTSLGIVRAGRLGLPWPWRWRRVRHYERYGNQIG